MFDLCATNGPWYSGLAPRAKPANRSPGIRGSFGVRRLHLVPVRPRSQRMKQKIRLVILLGACALGVSAAMGAAEAWPVGSFAERLRPAPVGSGFRMEGYFVWCGSAIKVDGEYHLFAARWPKEKDAKFPEGYRNHSEIVRATARQPLGPYTFQEVVVGKRADGSWDSHMAHNPTIHRIGDTFALFYIGSDGRTTQTNSKLLRRMIGYATAKSVRGPWQRVDRPIVEGDSNNPAVFVEPDGTVKLMFRDAALRVSVATADAFNGTYKVANGNVWPTSRLEDFYLFFQRGRYHLICEDNTAGVTGHERWGAHLVSANGIDGWTPFTPAIAYTHDIPFEDGSVLKCTRRERPQLLIENGKITHLFTAVYDGEGSWSQPVALSPPVPLSE